MLKAQISTLSGAIGTTGGPSVCTTEAISKPARTPGPGHGARSSHRPKSSEAQPHPPSPSIEQSQNASTEPAAPGTHNDDSISARVKPLRVVVLDDEEIIHELVRDILKNSAEFIDAGAFTQAKQAFREIPALAPDIALIDIGLPESSGIECVRQLREVCPDLKILMFTGREPSRQLVEESLRAGANGFLSKPCHPHEMLNALRFALAGGAPLSEATAAALFRSREAELREIWSALTPRQAEIARLLHKGYIYKEIADVMDISAATVTQHVHQIYARLNVHTRIEAVNKLCGRQD